MFNQNRLIMKTKVLLIALLFVFVCPVVVFAQVFTSTDIPNPAQVAGKDLKDVWGSDANNVFAVGQDGMFLKYDGSTAVQIANSSTELLLSVSGSSATDVWAVGYNGTAVHYNGTNLTVYSLGTSNTLKCVKAFAPNNVWACGRNGSIYHWNGSLWTAVSNPYSNFDFIHISGNSANIYFAGGDNFSPYVVKIYSYNGTAFTEILSDPSGREWFRIYTQDNNIFYLFGTGTYSFNKSTGIITDFPGIGSYGFHAFGASDILIAGGSSGISHFNGTIWQTLNSSLDYSAVYAPQNDRSSIYFIGDLGVFMKCELTVGIKEEALAPSNFTVMPNPAIDYITINLNLNRKTNVKIELLNVVGQQVKLLSDNSGDDEIKINISDLPAGTYLVKVVTEGNSSFNKKLIITK